MIKDGMRVACDGCGVDVGNGGVHGCTVISRLDFDTGMVENLHLCLDRGEGKKAIKGCSSKILTPARLAYYTEQRDAGGRGRVSKDQ